MKYIVETMGDFQLLDPSVPGGQLLPAHRPAVLEKTGFIGQRISLGQVRILAEVNDEATDAEFEQYLRESDGDRELALASFQSAFDPAQPSLDLKPKAKTSRVVKAATE